MGGWGGGEEGGLLVSTCVVGWLDYELRFPFFIFGIKRLVRGPYKLTFKFVYF